MSEEQDFDGIKENNNKLPTGWLIFYIAAIVFVIVYILMYTEELSGYSWNNDHKKEMKAEKAKQVEQDKSTATAAPKTDTGDANAIAEGDKIYKSTCMACHMADLKSGLSNLLTPKLKYGNSVEEITKTVMNGTDNGMPPHSFLGKEKIANVVAFIMSKREQK